MGSLSVWTAIALLMMLQTRVKGVPTEKLHHHMTKREIQYYFNVDDHDKVPEYDVSSPYQSNYEGDFVSYSMYPARTKRSTVLHDSSFYKLDAFGTKLHLKLKRNEHLMTPSIKVLRLNSDGTVTSHSAPENTFYLGHVDSDPRSTVAVSNDGGLTGIVKTSRDTLFVHPLPAHLAKHVTSSEDAIPHLVYRRSLKEDDVLLKNDFLHLDEEDGENNRLKRSMMSEDPVPKFKTLKVALLCPRSLENKYSQGNLHAVTGGVASYLLLLANMVAGMFQDPSFGTIKITYVVNKILIIDPAQYGFKQSDSNGQKLSSILSKVATDNAVQKVPFDVFSYVSDEIPVGALAIANQICKRPTGNVNKDIGLQTSLHIAHETGHNMFLDHDSGDCEKQRYIMFDNLPGGQHATEWSECSRGVIQRFLENNERSKCLDDGPLGDHPTLPPRFRDKLPGKIVDGDAQCEMSYGEGWKRHNPSNCAVLYCRKGNTALSRSVVVADGTECGLGKWCIKGRCEHSGVDINIVDGGWSEWGPYSQCTRECDGGIQYRERQCNNPKPNHGRDCHGESREHRICNPQECPSGADDFRKVQGQLQCDKARPNSTLYYLGGDVCGIYCREGNLVRRVGTFLDGTRCTNKKQDYSVCLQGKCRPVGCDHVLDSNTMFDRCGICGGDGNACRTVSAIYTDSPTQKGPENAGLVVELPAGTRNAFFMVEKDTRNYLGVLDAEGNYIVGGHLGGNQVKPAAGTVIHYTHRRSKAGKDRIAIVGPTNALLRVMYIKRSLNSGGNPGVKYQFLAQGSSPGPSPGYKWVPGDWSPCSRTCAVGTRTRDVRCVRIDDESPASNSACPGKMPEVEECNTQPCPATWTFSKWTPCSKTCGVGSQQRKLKCLHEVAPNDFKETNSCSEPKPTGPTIEICNRYPCPAEWSEGRWSACSTKCAIGNMRRKVSCSRIDESGNSTVIDPEFCRYLKKPPTEAKCNENEPCGPRPPTCPPNGHHCSNGGYCLPHPAGYKCVCDKGFIGVECEIKLNPCDKNPCLNGGVCSPGIIHHYDHTCKCPPLFTGRNCETKITACMSNPCINGATCTDKGLPDQYSCAPCPQGFMGPRCQVSTFYRIGCFNHKANVIPRLADLRKQVDLKDTYPTVIKCAELAQEKGYKYFSVGLNGICFSGPNAGETYFTKGPAPTKKCGKGIGAKAASVVFTFEPVPSYESLGCYRASAKKKPKPLRTRYINFRNQKNKQKEITINQCARVAMAKGYTHFAVQNTAECWSDVNAKDTYDDLGSSDKCKDGVGLKGANMVYHLNG